MLYKQGDCGSVAHTTKAFSFHVLCVQAYLCSGSVGRRKLHSPPKFLRETFKGHDAKKICPQDLQLSNCAVSWGQLEAIVIVLRRRASQVPKEESLWE